MGYVPRVATVSPRHVLHDGNPVDYRMRIVVLRTSILVIWWCHIINSIYTINQLTINQYECNMIRCDGKIFKQSARKFVKDKTDYFGQLVK